MSDYLYDLDGYVIAFRRAWDDPHVFDVDGDWIGWQPWEGSDVVGDDGRYLGSVVGDRLVRRNDCCDRVCRETVDHPDHVDPSGRPAAPLEFPNRFAYDDVLTRRRSR